MEIDMSIPEDMSIRARVLQKTDEAIGSWHARGRVDGTGKQIVRFYAVVHWIEYFGVLHLKFNVGTEDKTFPVVAPEKTFRIQKVWNVSDAGRCAIQWLDEVRKIVVSGHKELSGTDAFEMDEAWEKSAANEYGAG